MESEMKRRYPPLPGTEGTPAPPAEELEALRLKRGEAYEPRTRHLMEDGWARYTNRLFLEKSPYLLQHAHNPVNWFPWGDEPFELARQLNRPVLVSIGYATCHWCHVMEEESFESEEIASYLNQEFIAIKIDREERPDLDSIYMNALHAMGHQGGWPLNVFLTPDRKPFYGGTYFPPRNHTRGIGFLSLLKLLKDAYLREPGQVEEAGRQLTEAVGRILAPPQGEGVPSPALLASTMKHYKETFDPVHGSQRGAPKFPSTLPVRLLFRQYLASGDRELLEMATHTLRRMGAGGIYDQVGGGFHRYATDEGWLIPHFEKMLYDNALLAVAYLEGYQLSGDEEFARVSREILRYLQRDLASPEGAFYCATDADSPTPGGKREEGYFFTWTREELLRILGREEADLFSASFGVTERGNFEGRSILHLPKPLPEVAAQVGKREEELRRTLTEGKEVLYQERNRRPRPLRDEKILLSWNGLALSAFARGGFVLDDDDSLAQARRTASFLLERLTLRGRMTHSYQEGEPRGDAFLDDYAFFVAGLIDLFQSTGEAVWLRHALELEKVVHDDFADSSGGFFLTGKDHEKLIAREKPAYDGAVPSGNAVMTMNLLRLAALTGDESLQKKGEAALAAFSPIMAGSPAAATEMLLALDFHHREKAQLVVVAPAGNRRAAKPLLDEVRRAFLPDTVLISVTEGEELEDLAKLAPLVAGKQAEGERPVAYLCRTGRCLAPTVDPRNLAAQLRGGGGSSPLAQR
ncbi:thioredoxin domain-containing protein [Geomonas sp. RF6]|uniref:thioredoxin domain-containing protein n=1 Tax=Geomonas sp. RF6 TaxID=2897342 RepID=UPI001E40E7D5|nr:thioredoxin domain-containing protein [Geomonas sp. RF6]UFS71108.1 thioredoxin domain-containing protein [Geomonas sp. RF6]